MLVTGNMIIHNFPGIELNDSCISELDSERYLQPSIRFRFSIERRGNGFIVLWTIQPDGRYWEDDDGFGGNNTLEMLLYTFIDDQGNFTGPFRIYRLGSKKFY